MRSGKASPLAAGSSKTGAKLYRGSPTPVINNGKNTKSDQDKFRPKNSNNAGEMYKKPKPGTRKLVSQRSDESSGESLPYKQSNDPGCDNMTTYGQAKQNPQYNNDGIRPTKFIN
jgi:hypothetical protein